MLKTRNADTNAWWRATEELAGDEMEGRDTGSPAYDRAAALVAWRFAAGSAGRPLPSFDLPGRVVASLVVDERQTQSADVLGLLPGTDPRLARQVVVLSAHLDGYGYGQPVSGDGLYNGALDDAAMCAARTARGAARPGA